MAIDAFLQFAKGGTAATDIEGETQDREMKKLSPTPFDISTWTFGASQDVNVGSSSAGIGAGKVSFQPFKVTKQIDKSSPLFFQTCCQGGHYDECTLYVRKAGGQAGHSGDIYLKFDFKMVFVTEINWSHNDPSPTEDVTFDYGALQVSYKKQLKSGQLDNKWKQTAWSKMLNTDDFMVP